MAGITFKVRSGKANAVSDHQSVSEQCFMPFLISGDQKAVDEGEGDEVGMVWLGSSDG